jgi:hypothetical protein
VLIAKTKKNKFYNSCSTERPNYPVTRSSIRKPRPNYPSARELTCTSPAACSAIGT